MPQYTDAPTIAAALGVTFTTEQEAQAEALALAVTSFIDNYTGRSWQGTSPVTGELANVLPGSSAWPGSYGIVYLAMRPATAISAVSIRTAYPNATDTLLEIDQYELVDGPNGVLTLAASACYPDTLAVVDYTYAEAVPADISLAATMIASGQMARVLAVQAGSAAIAANPQLAGLESIALGQNDISIKVASSISSGGLAGAGSSAGSSWAAPGSAVAALLNPYRRIVFA